MWDRPSKPFSKNPAAVSAIQSVIESTSPLAICGTLLALAARTDTTPSLTAIKVPTLILVGEHDTLTPPAASQAMHSRINSSELHVLPGAAHMSNIENPEIFNAKFLEFLKKIART